MLQRVSDTHPQSTIHKGRTTSTKHTLRTSTQHIFTTCTTLTKHGMYYYIRHIPTMSQEDSIGDVREMTIYMPVSIARTWITLHVPCACKFQLPESQIKLQNSHSIKRIQNTIFVPWVWLITVFCTYFWNFEFRAKIKHIIRKYTHSDYIYILKNQISRHACFISENGKICKNNRIGRNQLKLMIFHCFPSHFFTCTLSSSKQ